MPNSGLEFGNGNPKKRKHSQFPSLCLQSDEPHDVVARQWIKSQYGVDLSNDEVEKVSRINVLGGEGG